MRGEDTLCCAQTGSGKTLLFLLPMLHELLGSGRGVKYKPQPVAFRQRGGWQKKTVLPAAPEALVRRGRAAQVKSGPRPLALALPTGRIQNRHLGQVLVHSRELALQIAHVARLLAAELPGELAGPVAPPTGTPPRPRRHPPHSGRLCGQGRSARRVPIRPGQGADAPVMSRDC